MLGPVSASSFNSSSFKNGEGSMVGTPGSMIEVAEVIVSPDLNVTFPPSEFVDARRWTKSFSPICVDDRG